MGYGVELLVQLPYEDIFLKEFIELNDKLLEETQAIQEFQDLTDYMDLMADNGYESAGKLRSAIGWTFSARPSTNEFGLDIFPGGYRSGDPGIFEEGEIAAFWWDFKDHLGLQQIFYIDARFNSVLVAPSLRFQNGYSVRCVAD